MNGARVCSLSRNLRVLQRRLPAHAAQGEEAGCAPQRGRWRAVRRCRHACPPNRLRVAACKLGGGGLRLGALAGGSHAPQRRGHTSLPPPCIPPLRLRVAACKLGVGGRRVGRWVGSNATRRREARGGGGAGTPSLHAGWPAARTPHAFPHFACALLPASWGVGASPWGARVAATPRGRGAAPNAGWQAVAASAAPAASTAPGRCCLQAGRWGRRLQFIIYILYVFNGWLQLIYYLIMWKRPACPPTQAGAPPRLPPLHLRVAA